MLTTFSTTIFTPTFTTIFTTELQLVKDWNFGKLANPDRSKVGDALDFSS